MIVYSRYNEAFKLSAKPSGSTNDGKIYDVPSDPAIQVKIFEKAYRTDEMERKVEDAISGMDIIEPAPQKTVYLNNRFAGYVMEKQAAPVPEHDPESFTTNKVTEVAVKTTEGPLPLIVLLAAGIVMTAVLILALFPAVSVYMEPTVRTVHFGGIPLAACGWGMLFFTVVKSGGVNWIYSFIGVLAYITGALLCSAAIWILVYLFFAVKALFIAVLPIVIAAVIIIAVLKSLIGGH